MQALGFIETKGLLAAIECADTMVKAANVVLLEKSYVGGGLVTVCVTGDVAAVKAAVEAGAASVMKLNKSLFISENVIPRPHEELSIIIGEEKPEEDETPSENAEEQQLPEAESEAEEKAEEVDELSSGTEEVLDTSTIDKDAIDKLFKEKGSEKTVELLNTLKLSKLRSLAREYKEFSIKGREISKADKEMLLNEFILHYK